MAIGSCPDGCNCSDNDTSVTCIQTDLAEMPILLSPRLESLTLRFNNINFIGQSSLMWVSKYRVELNWEELSQLLVFHAFRHFLTCRFLCVLYFEKLLLLHPWHFFPRFYTKLELIDLSHNKIVAVQDSSFTRSFNLKKLNLEGNKISKVTNETFAGLSKLQSLSLRKNEIVSLPAGAFSSNDQMKSS